VVPALKAWTDGLAQGREALRRCVVLGGCAALGVLFLASSMCIASGTYNPFLYFKF
jgi:hypothetical protein